MRARRIAGVTFLMIFAANARAGDSAAFTVSAQVIRSAAIRVETAARAGGVRLEARVRADRPAGVAVAAVVDEGATAVVAAPLSLDIAAPEGGGRVVVTILPDGRPPALRVAN